MDIWPELRALDIPADRPVTAAFRDQFLKACDESGPDTQGALILAVGGLIDAVCAMEGELNGVNDRLKKIEDTGITRPLPPGF